MSTLIIDTETSGRYDFNADPDDPRQPHLLEICVLDEGGQVLVNTLVQMPPNGRIDAEAAAVNGLTADMLARDGIPLAEALEQLTTACLKADSWVAFSARFDFNVINSACIRAGIPNPLANKTVCDVMFKMTPICKLPKPYGGGWKWPKLAEAYFHCFGKDMAGAHSAPADAYATGKFGDGCKVSNEK